MFLQILPFCGHNISFYWLKNVNILQICGCSLTLQIKEKMPQISEKTGLNLLVSGEVKGKKKCQTIYNKTQVSELVSIP